MSRPAAGPGLEHADIDRDATGAPYSARYGDVYASRAGALVQARHVFLGGCGLPAAWAHRAQWVVLEAGFGLGINFLATWQAWRDDPQRPARLHFVSVEKHPVRADDLTAHALPELAPLAQQLAACWPLPLAGPHRLSFEGGAVTLALALGDAQALLPQLVLGADAIYLDGFAPARNADLWDARICKALAHCARRGARLATWSSARLVRDGLAAAGFEVALRPGLGPKRDMLVARFAPRWTVRRHEPPAPYAGARAALVIGAGLAGCSTAYALAWRGWDVQLLDSGPAPATAASALPWGLLHPQLALDDNRLARLTRAGLFVSRAWLQRAAASDAAVWSDCGVHQQDDPQWRDALARQRMPARYACWREPDEAAAVLGLRPQRGGLWFELGAAVAPAAWCRALLASAGARVRTAWGVHVQAIERGADRWEVRLHDGARLAAPTVIVAGALESPRLLGLSHAPLRAVRGRVTALAPPALAGLRAAVAGDGHALRAPDGSAWAGATYELGLPRDGGDALDAARAHAGNLARLQRLLGDLPEAHAAGVFDGVRCVARDRLPLAGAVADEARALATPGLQGAHLDDLPRAPGLYALFALGSRGLTLAPLLAELIAAQIEGEPWPVQRDLAAAVDPARFLLQRLRRGAG